MILNQYYSAALAQAYKETLNDLNDDAAPAGGGDASLDLNGSHQLLF